MVGLKKFESFLVGFDEKSWFEALGNLSPLIHPVDQDATRIWFAFWPLHLLRIVQEADNIEQTELELELKGQYRLEKCLAFSIRFLFGSRYWSEVKAAVYDHAEASTPSDEGLAHHIQIIAKQLASSLQIPETHVTGITAVALMALRQVGLDVFDTSSVETHSPKSSLKQILKTRATKNQGGLLRFLSTVNAKYSVVFNEHEKNSFFRAIHGQDVSMAAGMDPGDYQEIDPRCTDGPVPFQCRTGTCGTCWMGVLSGKENLSPISAWEKDRLKCFGYDFGSYDQEPFPPIRLSCQAQCLGNIFITVAPWNGILNVQRFAVDGEPEAVANLEDSPSGQS